MRPVFFPYRISSVVQPIIVHIKNKIPFSSLTGTCSIPSDTSRSTIYAVATGGIRCALAVIRVSGPHTFEVLQKIGRFPLSSSLSSRKLPEPRKATLRKLYNPTSNKIIDQGILLWFPGPKSFTGEDSCEFHVHGGPAVITSVLQAIGTVPGCRIAEPGEFSRRAFLNGKMDLTSIEGLGDLITAETEMQRVQALNQMSGSLGSLYESWRDRLAKCLANAEAFIDFGEDENIESDVLEKVKMEIECLLEEMTNHLKDQKKGERLRNGVRVAILGRPNVGKSSLLNILSKRDAAIVSSIPGTTRDVVEACIDFKGYPVVFADTAGIRISPDEIEKEGIRRAIQEAEKADLVLLVMSYADIAEKLGRKFERHQPSYQTSDAFASTIADLDKRKLVEEELAELFLHKTETNKPDKLLEKVVLVANKVDLDLNTRNPHGIVADNAEDVFQEGKKNPFDAYISCKTLHGIDVFTEILSTKVAQMCSDPEFESPCLTRERHRSHLQNCMNSLEAYLNPLQNSEDLALRTFHLKLAVNNIGYITGHLGTEDILDIIFRDFCIGK